MWQSGNVLSEKEKHSHLPKLSQVIIFVKHRFEEAPALSAFKREKSLSSSWWLEILNEKSWKLTGGVSASQAVLHVSKHFWEIDGGKHWVLIIGRIAYSSDPWMHGTATVKVLGISSVDRSGEHLSWLHRLHDIPPEMVFLRCSPLVERSLSAKESPIRSTNMIHFSNNRHNIWL